MPDPYDTLIQGQYANDVQFIRQEGGLYFGDSFNLSNTPSTWTLRLGRYQGNYHGNHVDIRGYWIYKKNSNMCWQAVNRGGGALQYWNQDGHAMGNPEDWELFTFTPVKKQDQTVLVSNVSWPIFMRYQSGHVIPPNQDGSYVNLVGNGFSCNDTFAHAAVLVVNFI